MAKYLAFLALIYTILTPPAFAQTGHWEQLNPTVSPIRREAYGIASIGDKQALLFGGFGNQGYYNDTWLFDYNTKTWSELNIKVLPKKRSEFRMCQLSKNLILLFGGSQTEANYFDDTWIFDLSDTSWTKLELDTFPVARSHFGMATIAENKALLFGGEDSNWDTKNDTWLFDYAQKKWTLIPIKNYVPSPSYRTDPMVSQIEDRKIVLFGGFEYHYFKDTWLFDLDSLKWEKLNSTGMTDSLTSSGACSLTKDKMFIFGGESMGLARDNSWLFDFSDNNWNMVSVNISPPARMSTGLIKIEDGVALLFGGYDFNGPRNDTWIFTADSINGVSPENNFKKDSLISCYQQNSSILALEYSISKPCLVKIELLDLNGRIVESFGYYSDCTGIFRKDIALGDIPTGLYFIRFFTGMGFDVKKVIVIK